MAIEEKTENGKEKIKVVAAMDVYLPHMDGVINCMRNLLIHYPDDIERAAIAPSTDYVSGDPYPMVFYKGKKVPIFNVDFGLPSLDKDFYNRVMKMDIDIIHVHTPFGICKVLTKVAKEKNIPIVSTVHTSYKVIARKILRLPFIYLPYVRVLGKRYERMSEMYAGTKATENLLRRDFHYRGTCRIVPFGTSLMPSDNEQSLCERANKMFGIEPNRKVFCTVARVVRSKRVQFSLSALAEIKKRGYSFRFIIGGTGNYVNALKRKVKRLGLEREVIFSGYVSDDLLSAIYARSDLFLFPSVQDTFALVKVEAATFHTPGLFIKGTDTAYGTTHMVNSLHAENNVKDFADKIEWALNNEDEMKKISENAFRDLYYSWEDTAKLMDDEYRRAIRLFREKHGDKKKIN